MRHITAQLSVCLSVVVMSLWSTTSWALPTLQWQETDNGDGSYTYLFEINPNTTPTNASFLELTIEGNLNQVQLTDPTAIDVNGGDPNIAFASQRGIGIALDPTYLANSSRDTFIVDELFPGKIITDPTPSDGTQSLHVVMVSLAGDIGGPVPNDEFFVLAQVTVLGGDLSVSGELLSVIGEPGDFGATFTTGFADDSVNFVNTDFDATLVGDDVPGWYYEATVGGTTTTAPLVRSTPEPGVEGVFVYDETYSLPPLEGTHSVLMQANGETSVALAQDRLFPAELHTLEFLADLGDSVLKDLTVLVNDVPLELFVFSEYDFMGRTVSVLRADVSPFGGSVGELKFVVDPLDGISDVMIAIDGINLLVPEPASLVFAMLGLVAVSVTARRRC